MHKRVHTILLSSSTWKIEQRQE